MMPDPILVTGGSGFIGENLVRKLAEDGHEVTCLVRDLTDRSRLESISKQIRFVTFDGSLESLGLAFKDIRYQTVFHLATLAKYDHVAEDIPAMLQANVIFGTQLAEAMAASGSCNLVNACTFWQYYHSREYQPLNLYAATKQAFVDILRYYSVQRNISVANVILFDTYGPGDTRQKLPSAVLKNSEKPQDIDLSPGDQLTDLTHIHDVVQALQIAAARIKNTTSEFNTFIASKNGHPETLKTAITKLAQEYGTNKRLNWGKKNYRDKEVFKIDIYDQFENILKPPDTDISQTSHD